MNICILSRSLVDDGATPPEKSECNVYKNPFLWSQRFLLYLVSQHAEAQLIWDNFKYSLTLDDKESVKRSVWLVRRSHSWRELVPEAWTGEEPPLDRLCATLSRTFIYRTVKRSEWISVLIWWVVRHGRCLRLHIKGNGRVLMGGHVPGEKRRSRSDTNGHVLMSIITAVKLLVNLRLRLFQTWRSVKRCHSMGKQIENTPFAQKHVYFFTASLNLWAGAGGDTK